MAAQQFKVNRIIFISDGQPTEGITNHQQLIRIARDIRAQGVTISSIGVGTDFNEDLMQDIAEHGSGAYAYLHEASQLATIFQKDLQQASTTIARDVQLRLALPAGAQLGEVLGYRSQQEGQTVKIPLSDFSAGQVERVVVRVRVDGREAGKTVDVAGLSLDYLDLLKNGPARSAAQLSAMVTDRKEEVARNQDKEATVYAARAQSAINLQNAAESLRRGDKAAARQYIQANEMLFEGAAQVAGPAAVQADMADQKAIWGEMDAASSAEEVEHQVKSAKKKARQSAGKLGSTY
jgi:Ca-activated chloride channel family protein